MQALCVTSFMCNTQFCVPTNFFVTHQWICYQSVLPYQCFVVVMASHSHVQLDASRKTRCYCYLINHTRLIHSDFRVSLVCFAGHKTKKFRSKRPAPRQTTTKRKLLSAHVIFAKLGLIHQPNYLTLANRWGPNNNVNKSCSFFFFLQMPPF